MTLALPAYSTTSDSDLPPASPGSVVRHNSAEQRYIAPGRFVYIYNSMF